MGNGGTVGAERAARKETNPGVERSEVTCGGASGFRAAWNGGRKRSENDDDDDGGGDARRRFRARGGEGAYPIEKSGGPVADSSSFLRLASDVVVIVAVEASTGSPFPPLSVFLPPAVSAAFDIEYSFSQFL